MRDSCCLVRAKKALFSFVCCFFLLFLPGLGFTALPSIDEDLFLTSELSPDTVVRGAQATYSFRLYATLEVLQKMVEPYLKEPETPGIEWRVLGAPQQREENRNGKFYQVVEQKFAVFSTQEGEIQIPGVIFSAIVQEDLGPFINQGDQMVSASLLMRQHSIQLNAPQQILKVLPMPELLDENALAAQKLELREVWDHSNLELTAGELLTRTVYLRARGARGQNLPEIPIVQSQEVNIYGTPMVRSDTIETGFVIGKGTQKIVYLFTKAGDQVLPEIRISYWNTEKRARDFAVLPAQTIHVLPSKEQALKPSEPQGSSVSEIKPSASDAMNAVQSTEPDQFWQGIALGCLLLWLVTVILAWLFFRKKRQRGGHDNEELHHQPFKKRLHQAIQHHDALLLESCLLEWGEKILGERYRSLGELRAAIQGQELRIWIQNLEHSLYGKKPSPVETVELMMLLKQEKSLLRMREHRSVLPDLYEKEE